MRGVILVPALATLFTSVSALPPARPDAGIDPEITTDEHTNVPAPSSDDTVAADRTHYPPEWTIYGFGNEAHEVHDDQKVLVSQDLNSNDLEKRDNQPRNSGYDEYPKDKSFSFDLRVHVKVDPTKCRAAVTSDDFRVAKVDFTQCGHEGLTLKFEVEREDSGQYNYDQGDYPGDRNKDQNPWDREDKYPDSYEDYGRNKDYGRNGYGNNGFDRQDYGDNGFGRNNYGNNDFDRQDYGDNGFGRNNYDNNDFDRYNEQCLPRCQCSPEDDNCKLCKARCQCKPDNDYNEQCLPRCQCSPEDDKCKKCNSICQCSSGGAWKQTEDQSDNTIEFEDCGDSDTCEALDTLLTRDTSGSGDGGYSRSSRYGDSGNGGSAYDYLFGDDRNGGSGYGFEKHESSSYDSDYPDFDYPSQGNRGSDEGYRCPSGDCPPQKNKDKWLFVLKGFPLYENDEYSQGGNNGYDMGKAGPPGNGFGGGRWQ